MVWLIMRDKKHLIIKTNDNEEVVREVRSALKKNDGYCPCKVEHKRENRCICKEFREQQVEGECHCGLYKKVYSE